MGRIKTSQDSQNIIPIERAGPGLDSFFLGVLVKNGRDMEDCDIFDIDVDYCLILLAHWIK